MADTRNLERRPGRESWYAVVDVPRDAQEAVGRKRLRRSLRTSSLREAQRRRGPVVAELWRHVEEQRRCYGPSSRERDKVLAHAREIAAEWRDADPETQETIPFTIEQEAQRVRRQHDGELAKTFVAVANNKLTTVADKMQTWRAEAAVTSKTRANYEGAVREFLHWNGGEAFVERVTRRVAGRYITDHLGDQGLRPQAINKKVSALSSFWKWLVKRGHAEDNPWHGQGLATKATNRGSAADTKERPFSDSEVSTLLRHAPNQTMRDFLMVLLLSGMRREEAAQLTVGDVVYRAFVVREGKTANAVRRVPIHPALGEFVARRTGGKTADAYLFHELRDSSQGRADALGKQFTRFRRQVGVDEQGDGRRGKVNIHSARRWFQTKAEQAGQPPHVIESVCGQARQGMFGVYSGGPSKAQRKACIEAVALPPET